MRMRRKSKSDFVIDGVVYAVLFLLALICIYPLVYCASASISSDEAILTQSIRLLPKGISLDSYKMVLENKRFSTSFVNAVYYTVVGTVIQVTGTLLYGYVFSRKDFVFRKFLAIFTLIPMVFNGGLIPTFMVIKEMGLYGSYWALFLYNMVSLWNALIAKTFFQNTIPPSLYEAARIDGCSQFQVFLRIVLPLSKTIIAILALYAGVGFWNDYFGPMIYITDKAKQPLQVLLAEILAAGESAGMSGIMSVSLFDSVVDNLRIKYVVIMVSTLPIMVIYPFIQKFFVKGVMIGSVKE